jgi:hypothetical protein
MAPRPRQAPVRRPALSSRSTCPGLCRADRPPSTARTASSARSDRQPAQIVISMVLERAAILRQDDQMIAAGECVFRVRLLPQPPGFRGVGARADH